MAETNITYADIEEIVKGYMQKAKNEDEIFFFSGCLERGMVQRSSLDLNLCSNPDCKNCTELQAQMVRSLESF
jgi:hypothetical protein